MKILLITIHKKITLLFFVFVFILINIKINAQRTHKYSNCLISFDKSEIHFYELPQNVDINSLSILEQYKIRKRSIESSHEFKFDDDGNMSYTITPIRSTDFSEPWMNTSTRTTITKEGILISLKEPNSKGETEVF